MATTYFKKLRRHSKQHESHEVTAPPPAPAVSEPSEEPGSEPVLDAEDEKFLQRLAAIAQEPEGPAPALPERPVVILASGEVKAGRDAQQAIMDGADAVPLPMSPPEVTVEGSDKGKGKASEGDTTEARRKSLMSYFTLAQSKFKRSDKDKTEDKDKKKGRASSKDRKNAADTLAAAAELAKTSEAAEKQKENEDLSKILDDLNLSAVNNRVFSFSKESEELLNKFKLVLKDIVNGAPTAYNDLEKLFTDYDNQLKKMYGGLPPFLQNMIKSLPSKLTAALGPEILAMQAEKPGFDGKQKGMGTASASKSKSKRARVPSLKSLISAEGAVATMLKSILNFLKLRFPVLMTGTNVLLSVAVFRKSLSLPPSLSFSPPLSMPDTNTSQSSSSSSGTATNAAAKPVSTKSVSPAKPLTRPSAAKPPTTTATRSSVNPRLPTPTPTPRIRIKMRRRQNRHSSSAITRRKVQAQTSMICRQYCICRIRRRCRCPRRRRRRRRRRRSCRCRSEEEDEDKRGG
jgi:hypothetical protein